MESGRTNVRVPKTAEIVADRIRRQIVLGELHEGDSLASETELMQGFGIARPTLREAFRILESEGLIVVLRGAHGGGRVLEPSLDVVARSAGLVLQHRGTTVADVLDARVIVEAPAARMLAMKRHRAAIAAELQELNDSLDPDEVDTFYEFNNRLVSLAGNQTLILITRTLEYISQAAALSYKRRPQPDDDHLARKAARARQRLIELIRDGQAEEAEELWRAYLTESGRVMAGNAGGHVVDLFS